MQLQFHRVKVPCQQKVREENPYQELTQELRLPGEMADIGSVLGAWGQILIRGKEWRSDGMIVTGGVMAWAMYQPEEGGQPQMVEAWIPFQFKSDLPQTQYDGVIRVCPLLRSIDARSTSARKLMIRASVGNLTQAWVPMDGEVCQPEEIPEDIQLLNKTYPIQLPREAGEKIFTLEEELTLPASAPRLDKLLRFSLQPELIDQKVMAGKVVFRGMGLVHILYMGEDARLHSWDFEVPFSQYSDLESEFGEEAIASIWPAVTALEMDQDPEGFLRLKAGLTGQYLIMDRTMVSVVEDAYGTNSHVTPQLELLELPVVLDLSGQTVSAEESLSDEQLQIVDVVFYPDHSRLHRTETGVLAELSGVFHALGYDGDGTLQGSMSHWEDTLALPASEDTDPLIKLQPSGTAQVSGSGNRVRGDVLAEIITEASRGIPMVTELQIEEKTPDPERPSLILRKLGDETLWELAKSTGSTVRAILEANGISEDPEPGKVLLIPMQ